MLDTLTPFSKRVALVLCMSAIVLNVVLALVPWTPASGETVGKAGRSPTQRVTTLHHAAAAGTFWTRRHVEDSWGAMLHAWDYRRQHPQARLYEDLFFGKAGASTDSPAGQLKFQYPPSSLLAVEGVARLVPRRGDPPMGDHARYFVLNAIGYVMLWATAALVGAILVRSFGVHQIGHDLMMDRVVCFGLGIAATLTFYPIIKAFTLGQIQAWLNAGAALAIWCWIRGRREASGVVLALMCAVKPQYGVFLIWAALRRQGGAALGFLATLSIVGLVSVGAYGWQNHLDDLGVLQHIARHGEAFFPNQSVNGLLHRAFHNGNINEWDGASFPPLNAVVTWGTTASSLALLIIGLWPWRVRGRTNAAARTNAQRPEALMVVLLAATMASPVAWEHHYGLMLPIFAWLAPALVRRPVLGRWTMPLLVGLYVVASNYFGLLRNLAEGPGNILLSSLFFAACGVLLVLVRLLCKPPFGGGEGTGVPAPVPSPRPSLAAHATPG